MSVEVPVVSTENNKSEHVEVPMNDDQMVTSNKVKKMLKIVLCTLPIAMVLSFATTIMFNTYVIPIDGKIIAYSVV